jgi:hypothetical protein
MTSAANCPYLTAILAIIAVAACNRVSFSEPPKPDDIPATMKWAADQAVQTAMECGGIKLDYSLESIKLAENALEKINEEFVKTKSKDGLDGLSFAFGAYIGECIRRHDPNVTWKRDHPVAGEKSYPLHWRDSDVFPIAWCHERIFNGPDENVWIKYQVAKQTGTATTEPSTTQGK